jgi:hypothetical protein
MTASEYLGSYAAGWKKGNAETILQSAAKEYTFDDPSAGVSQRSDFQRYLSQLKDQVKRTRGKGADDSFMELSHVVTQQEDDAITAWCWWEIPGTKLKGAGLINVGPDGVRSERITYYTKYAD